MSSGLRRSLIVLATAIAAYQLCVVVHATWFHHADPPFLAGLLLAGVGGGLGTMGAIWVLQGFQVDRMKRAAAPLS